MRHLRFVGNMAYAADCIAANTANFREPIPHFKHRLQSHVAVPALKHAHCAVKGHQMQPRPLRFKKMPRFLAPITRIVRIKEHSAVFFNEIIDRLKLRCVVCLYRRNPISFRSEGNKRRYARKFEPPYKRIIHDAGDTRPRWRTAVYGERVCFNLCKHGLTA